MPRGRAEPVDTWPDIIWNVFKLMVAFTPLLILAFCFIGSNESSDKERKKRAKKHDFHVGDGTGE
jgi:hypothetical protein